MDNVQLQSIIAGAIVSVITSILKRWIVLDKKITALLVLAVSFLVASGFFLLNGKTWEEYITQIATVYASSQVVYWIVMKSLGWEDVLSGRKEEVE